MYLYENKERNRFGEFNKADVLSVSGDYGIINQIELLGRSFAGKSVTDYHVVRAGDVVYTKSPLKEYPYGIVKYNNGEDGIVSTLYAVYHLMDNADGRFIEYYFTNPQRTNRYFKPIVRIGAKHDMKIGNAEVLDNYVVFPVLTEQRRITKMLSLLDERIVIQNKVIENYQSLIRAITQVFFGGKSDCPLIPLSELSPNIASGKNKPALGPFPLYGSTGLIGTCTSGTYKGEMILVARVGSIGQIQLINTKGCGITDNTLIVNSGELNQYVYFYLKSFDFQKITSGTTQPLITGSSLKAINIPVLPFQERDSFVKLLEAIERRITLEQSVLRHYLNTKSFFLANLFV